MERKTYYDYIYCNRRYMPQVPVSIIDIINAIPHDRNLPAFDMNSVLFQTPDICIRATHKKTFISSNSRFTSVTPKSVYKIVGTDDRELNLQERALLQVTDFTNYMIYDTPHLGYSYEIDMEVPEYCSFAEYIVELYMKLGIMKNDYMGLSSIFKYHLASQKESFISKHSKVLVKGIAAAVLFTSIYSSFMFL